MKYIGLIMLFVLTSMTLTAQPEKERIEKITVNGQPVLVAIVGRDTVILGGTLDEVTVSEKYNFKTGGERIYYSRMRTHARKVHPYAIEAVKLFRQIETETADMKGRKKNRYIKDMQEEVRVKFEEPLKNLTRAQGHILLDMIERELGTSTFDVIKDVKGGFTAFYWNQLGKGFGYDLKEAYDPKNDPILEAVLQEFDIPDSFPSNK